MHFVCHLYMINKFKCSELQHLNILYNKRLQVCLVCSIPLLLGRTYMMKYPSFTALLFNLQVLEHWMVERPRNMEHYGNNILLICIFTAS